ncbi:hypothetical protein [Arenivirga flava]|uniref:Uncharacterized protein n=1 Tax=Arenivirga flava TaxID=1930060 RepID=A0AA37UNB4_9MICO|nr:hypothetical protein [Arenivirga flava]GMA26797.1 hypothetical protein GCM10025874_00500 [Arenivirga flava]GMA29913.1 hypothetical protein GCM10025874_31660 [Arenivirga flava]GMA29958.1 hypothetical protein GCM10025874_32110 [Arenivirga flava]
MDYPEALALWIQTAAVVVAVGASVVALIVSWRDRVNSRRIAAEDRRASIEQAKLMLDLEMMIRLLQNRNRGGSSDPQERKVMGAEALTLVGLLGRDLVPEQWDRQVGHDEEGFQKFLEDPDWPEWKKDAIEVQIAMDRTVARIRALSERPSTA